MVLTHNHSIGTIWIFAHWLIMVRSRNWPDLWSQIAKIRDVEVAGIYDLMKRWRFETNRTSSVATAQPQSQKHVFDFDLTWWPDLWWPGLKFLHKVSNSIVSRYWKNGRAAHRRFSAIREKPEWWAYLPPPPPVRVLGDRCRKHGWFSEHVMAPPARKDIPEAVMVIPFAYF